MKNVRLALVLPLALFSLTGCSTVSGWFDSSDEGDQTQVTAITTPAPDSGDITARLAEAAQRTANAVENLQSIEQARTPELYTPVVSEVPPELRILITVQWTGPWESRAPRPSVLAISSFWRFASIVVTVDAKQQPYVDVMRNIGLQAAGRADLVLDSQNKVVEIRYAPDTGR